MPSQGKSTGIKSKWVVTRALERGTGEVSANRGWVSLQGDGYALEWDPCDGCTTWWTVLKLNSVLYDKEFYAIWIWKKGKPSTRKRIVQGPGAAVQFDVLKSPAVCSGRRLVFATLWDHRPQPVSITSLAPYCPSLSFLERQSLSITAREGLLHGVELSRWVSLRFQLGQQFIESPHSTWNSCGWTRAWEGQVLPEEKLLGAVRFISKNFNHSAAVGTCKISKAPDLVFRLFLTATEDGSAFACISSCWADTNSRWGWEGRWWWDRATPGGRDQWLAPGAVGEMVISKV